MGIDIHVGTNNYKEIYKEDYYRQKDIFGLSRTFCNFILRQNVVSHETEFERIGKLTGVNLELVYAMQNYPDEEGLAFFLERAETENERKIILEKAEENKAKVHDNIDKVIQMVTELIDKLSAIDDLPALLLPTDFDALNNQVYFSDFNAGKRQSYVRNNFGQDLRNMQRFLEFAKAKGTSSVWFYFG